MSKREHYYHQETGQIAVVFTTVDSIGDECWTAYVVGEGINQELAYELSDDIKWVQINSDNTQLFIDAVTEEIEQMEALMRPLHNKIRFLETLLED